MAVTTSSSPFPRKMAIRSLPKPSGIHPTPCSEPIHLSPRFAAIKQDIIAGRADALTASWNRLLSALQEEIRLVSSLDIIPTIDFSDISHPTRAAAFQRELRVRGVAIIRRVVPRPTALAWQDEATTYIHQNHHNSPHPPDAIYWSPAQIHARAHPSILAAHRFAMQCWTPSPGFSTCSPLSYADKLRLPPAPHRKPRPLAAHLDSGSTERFEPEGYGKAGTYAAIFSGDFESHAPWSSALRVPAAPDLYNSTSSCSIFRAFNGHLALSATPAAALRFCPLDLRLSTAYLLLRPFFSPATDRLVSPPTTLLHGALPSYAQAVTPQLHPHLELGRSLVGLPRLEPGDYVIWHPDAIYAWDEGVPGLQGSMGMYLPAVPVTQTNVLYLARQRKAFVTGEAGPDFFAGGRGEMGHVGRPGLAELERAGGKEGLRAMGLVPFDEEEADGDEERAVLAMANEILFPGLYDY